MDSSSQTLSNGAPLENGLSQATETSQTAQDYIASQLSLEADAREALPYQFDSCTKPLGPLRQSVYACLTCTPPPASVHQQFTPAGVCYSCSISCHGEHNLVELFTKRDFVCDCGTTRMSNSGTSCNLRLNPETGRKGVNSEQAREGNKYNQNFEGKFCGCEEEYDPEKEKGTMFQCLGLGTVEDGGCGEDWWHPECLMGLPRAKHETHAKTETNGALETLKEEEEGDEQPTANGEPHGHQHEEPSLPPGFPGEDDFDHLICYKCVNAFPWIKQYASSPGFLTAEATNHGHRDPAAAPSTSESSIGTLKRKAEDDTEDSQESKKYKVDPDAPAPSEQAAAQTNGDHPPPKHTTLPPAPSSPAITLFLKEDFREHLCRCSECFPRLAKHRQLLEEEDSYEPPLSESDGAVEDGSRSVHSGSLLERGEAALSSMDRVRAIEGVMAYNHVRDKVKDFLKPYAESGKMVSAEEVKAYFAKLRGDEQATAVAANGEDGVKQDHRREQGGC